MNSVSLCLFKSNLNAQDKLGQIGLTGAYSAAGSALLSIGCGLLQHSCGVIHLVTAGALLHTFYKYNPYRMPVDLAQL